MRFVLDTSVLVAAIRSPNGASKQLIRSALQGRYALLLSVTMAIEYEAVLNRDEHLQASGLSQSDVDRLLDALVAISKPVRLSFLWRPALRDPDDDMVLEAAVNGRADAIVTFNQRDFAGATKSFGIQILSPGEAYERIKDHEKK